MKLLLTVAVLLTFIAIVRALRREFSPPDRPQLDDRLLAASPRDRWLSRSLR